MSQEPDLTFEDWLIFLLVGRELGEAISGDLQEQTRAEGASSSSYGLAYMRSLPGFVRIGWSAISPTRFRAEICIGLLAVSLAWMWELCVAQAYAWPIASNFYKGSPFSVATTCKLAYLGLFGLGMASLLIGWVALNVATQSSWRLRVHRFVMWSMAGLIPVVYLLLNPGPHDGDPVFRYVQIMIVAFFGCLVVLCCRSHLKPANTPSAAISSGA